MDTKWNRTSEKTKGFVSLAALLLGVSLLAGSILGAGRLALETDKDMEWWRSDWQETTAFKQEVSEYLKDFLELHSGEELYWYNLSYRKEKEDLLPGSDYVGYYGWTIAAESPASAAAPAFDWSMKEPDAEYQWDSNVLYSVTYGSAEADSVKKRENVAAIYVRPVDTANKSFTNASTLADDWNDLPEEYNFTLFYQEGQVTLQKNGEKLDVYGNGVYNDAEQWYVPGYNNFEAVEDGSNVRVRMAVRAQPIQIYGEGYAQSSRMYSLYESYCGYRESARNLLLMLAVSLVLLALAHALGNYRGLACRSVAKVTNYLPGELWPLMILGFTLYHVFLTEGVYWLSDIVYLVFTKGKYLAILTGLCAALPPTTPLFALGWTLWLLRNDHRYNPPEKRRGLLNALRARDLNAPVQKRLRRNAFAGLFAMVVLAVCLLPVVIRLLPSLLGGYYLSRWWYYAGAFALVGLLLLLAMIISAVQSLHLAKDIGLLTAHITAIREGDLTTPLDLPKNADLCRAAEELNDIQSGLDAALQERTKSERMKVELISNVSHDLKTPLTSVLSYAALLEEEDLPGAAGDYARIILEKAKRLDTMVQDVFSISKAASGQLKLEPERLDLGKLLRQTLADMEDAIEKSGLTIKTDIPEESVDIVADGQRLYRVFQNLIQNALQYSLPGSRVYLTLKVEGERAIAAVRNTSAAEIPAGVDFTARFVRGDESRTDGGTGLGLSIAKTFTESCGGEFSVETLADLFTAKVTFPLA